MHTWSLQIASLSLHLLLHRVTRSTRLASVVLRTRVFRFALSDELRESSQLLETNSFWLFRSTASIVRPHEGGSSQAWLTQHVLRWRSMGTGNLLDIVLFAEAADPDLTIVLVLLRQCVQSKHVDERRSHFL